jgi:hypothetical protein
MERELYILGVVEEEGSWDHIVGFHRRLGRTSDQLASWHHAWPSP